MISSRYLKTLSDDPAELFDVIAVTLEGSNVRLIAHGKTERNAEAITSMAVMHRGVDEEFFAAVPAGLWKDGDTYNSQD